MGPGAGHRVRPVQEEPMTRQASQCSSCRHLSQPDGTPRAKCAAFPRGVPVAVLNNELDHRELVYGDKGIRWEAAAASSVHPRAVR